MFSRIDPYLPSLDLFSEKCGSMVIALEILALPRWAFNMASLKSVLPGQVAMYPASASVFIFCGATLGLAQVLAFMVLLGSVRTLIIYPYKMTFVSRFESSSNLPEPYTLYWDKWHLATKRRQWI